MRPISSQFLALKTAALFMLWVMLSGKFNLFHLGLGGILSFLVAWVNSGHSPFIPRFDIWGKVLLYIPWLLTRIVKSSLHVTRLILHPHLPIHPRLIHYESTLQELSAVVLLGNSITLTPGTITAEVNDHTLLVHALDEVSGEDVTSRRLESRIARIFKEKEPRP